MLPQITIPTRVTRTSASLIDHIYRTTDNNNCTAGTIISDITDHYINFILTKKFVRRTIPPKRVTYRPYSSANIAKFNTYLEESCDWNTILGLSDVNEAYDSFVSEYNKALNVCIPLTSKRIDRFKHKQNPWITRGILQSLKTKNKLYKQKVSCRNHNDEIQKRYNNYRNILHKTIRLAKQRYWENRLSEAKHDMKRMWNSINSLLGKNKSKKELPEYFMHENKTIKDPKDIANIFNNFYVSIGPSLADSLPCVNSAMNTLPAVNLMNSFYLAPTTEEEILKIISILKPKTSTGNDEISSKLIKQSSKIISKPLCHIINLSLSSGIVPNNMKIAKVIPIYKNEDPKLIKNYRPISLLPSFSKIIEKIVLKRLNMYLTEKSILSSTQYGFRENHSTELAILEFQNRIIKNLNRKKHSIGLFLDLSKAFDSLQHDILLKKLEHYGIRGISLNWFKSYLSDRQQFVAFKNINSDISHVSCGVPQGSILGPVLFLLYVNDLANTLNNAKFVLFADDTNIIFENENYQTLAKDVKNGLKSLSEWFNQNKLSINAKKTKVIQFNSDINANVNSLVLYLNGTQIEHANSIKFLGIKIQHNLKWDMHCTEKANKMSQILGLLSRMRNTLTVPVMTTIYQSLMEPHLNYGILSWGKAPKKCLKRLKIIQKKAVRVINKARYNSHTNALFKKSNILKFDDILRINCAKLIFKKNRGQLPTFHSRQLLNNQEYLQSDRITRQAKDIYVLPHPNQISKQTLNFVVGTNWNNLPNEIKDMVTSNMTYRTFVKQTKKILLLTYNTACNIQNCYICRIMTS